MKQKPSPEPEGIPWDALQALMSCIYGGRIDNEFDQKLLTAFLVKLFKQECLGESFKLFSDRLDVISLDLSRNASLKSDYLDWISKINSNQKPSWLGLPNNAERILLTNMGRPSFRVLEKLNSDNCYVFFQAMEMLSNLLICQSNDEDLINSESPKVSENVAVDNSYSFKLGSKATIWRVKIKSTI